MKYVILLLLVALGAMGLLLANEREEHAKTQRDYAVERRALSDDVTKKTTELRKKDQQLALANMEIADGQTKLTTERNKRAADARAANRLLVDTAAAIGSGKRPTNPEAARYFDAATVAGGLVGECSTRRLEVAEAATELRDKVTGLQAYVTNVCTKEK